MQYIPQKGKNHMDALVYGALVHHFARWREAIEYAQACRTSTERVWALKTAGIARRRIARLKGFSVICTAERQWL